MKNQDAIVYLEGQWDCMCSEDCQIYTGHKDCPQGFICNDGQALQMAISALQAQDLQQTCNQLATDCISRSDAIDAFGLSEKTRKYGGDHSGYDTMMLYEIQDTLESLPSVQPDGIPLEWIDKHLEWLDNCDNDFAQLAKVGIRAMVELWKKDRI